MELSPKACRYIELAIENKPSVEEFEQLDEIWYELSVDEKEHINEMHKASKKE